MEPDNSGSNDWQRKSIKLYESILRNYPRYARADQATFYLGSALQDVGDKGQAVEAFKKLVKLYPQSSFVPDSYVLIGEYFFDNDNAYGALKAYLKATQYKDSEKYPFAMYKLAWCYYNVGDYGKGIETMKAVVAHAMADQNQKTGIRLEEEALKDLVRFFADAGAMNEAYEYFTKLGKKDLIRSMLKRLAGMYFEQGKFEESVETYRRLILEDPQDEHCPEYQAEIISAYRKIGQKQRTLEEIDRMLRDYGKDSAWARANASNPSAVKAAENTLEENLRRVAADYHTQARKLEKTRHHSADETYQLARQAYATYINEFPGNEHAYDVRYAYGELLYKLKDFESAYTQYMAVVALDPKGKHSRFCAESSIFAAEEQVKLEGGALASGKTTAKVGEMTEPQPLTDWEQRLVEACKQYAELYPNDKKVRNIIYKSAFLLYNKYRFEEAADQFRVVIQMDPKSSQAEQAANLILDSFVVRKDWANLKENSKFYYDQPSLGSAKFKKDTYDVYQRASFKLIEVTLEKDENYGQAGNSFVAFYEEFPEADTAAQALNNASVYYHRVNRVADAMTVRHILVEDPKFGDETKYYYDQIGSLGYDYETIADFDKAAFYYEKLWSLYPEERKELAKDDNADLTSIDAKAGDAIYSAAVFRNALGSWQPAIDNYSAFTDEFTADERVPEVLLTIAGVYEDQEQWDNAANTFRAFYTKPPEGVPLEFIYFARLHAGRAYENLGKTRDRDKVYNETIKMYEKYIAGGGEQGQHTEFVAEMMYKLAQPQLNDYLALEIKGKGSGASQKAEDKALGDSLSKKTKEFLAVQTTFTSVVKTGAGEWGLASLVALGKAFENMGDTLTNGDAPFYLSDQQREIYSMAVEDKVFVQEEKAVEAYRLALEKSYELTLYNENTAYATRQLGVLRPDDYPGLQEELLDSRYTSSKVRLYEPEQSL
jgi:TolA-binding protein